MKTIRTLMSHLLTAVTAVAFCSSATSGQTELSVSREATEMPANFRRENLVAWCIVPFDAKKRSPEERSRMLVELGLKHCAYDWREEHVPTFEREIAAYKENGIEFSAFWSQHDVAFQLFQEHDMQPQIWSMIQQPDAASQEDKIAEAVATMLPLAKRCKSMDCKLGLYNHGGWTGQPENLVAVCKALQTAGYVNVGIVYNLHHAHDQITGGQFNETFPRLKPLLLCLNLNGMVDLEQFKTAAEKKAHKIQPIGSGNHEAAMIKTVIESGYHGPIGVLGHVASRDAKEVLRENIEGLEFLLGARTKPDWLSRLDEVD